MKYLMWFAISLLNIGVFSSCNTKPINRFQKVVNELKQMPGFQMPNHIKAIIRLDDQECVPCSRKFSELVQNQAGDTTVLFIITASPQRVDLSAYQVENSNSGSIPGNIYFDKGGIKSSFKDAKGSYIIFFSGTIPDTMVNIKAKEMDHAFSYIQQRFSQKAP